MKRGEIEEHGCDMVVVGSGIAGLSAAVTARHRGASVCILERAPPEDRGGNTRWTEAFLRMKSEHAVAEDFISHFAKHAGHHLDPELVAETAGDFASRSAIARTLGFSDPDLIARFADEAPAAVQWLKGFGVRFGFLPMYFITTSTTRLGTVGGGRAMIEALGAWADANGIATHYRTTARALMQDETGAVVGVEAVADRNRPVRFRAPAVVLACGGFEGNPEMLARYLGPQSRYIRPVARGGYYNRGEGLAMALAIGAAPSGDWARFHAEPLDPRSGAPEPVVMVFNYGILVDTRGRRFTDEAPSSADATYEAVTRIIGEQPEGMAWLILDARIDRIAGWQRAVRSDQPAIEAPSLADLALRIGVPPDELAATVKAFNAAVVSPEAAFDPERPDGVRTRAGYEPRKSNWAFPLAVAPWRAYPIICGNCFTFGGLKVDPDARVLNMDGEAIPGLYAAGETIGLYWGTYTGATSVLRGAVFGRIAGAAASPGATT
ncbi:MAG TPA: FAD-dependent oxidoreductase [Hyphomicrobiaceae bacterium]|nr:FAD-dependent oxidoreductase [Hyphomicrobiaceae bacterium]